MKQCMDDHKRKLCVLTTVSAARMSPNGRSTDKDQRFSCKAWLRMAAHAHSMLARGWRGGRTLKLMSHLVMTWQGRACGLAWKLAIGPFVPGEEGLHYRHGCL